MTFSSPCRVSFSARWFLTQHRKQKQKRKKSYFQGGSIAHSLKQFRLDFNPREQDLSARGISSKYPKALIQNRGRRGWEKYVHPSLCKLVDSRVMLMIKMTMMQNFALCILCHKSDILFPGLKRWKIWQGSPCCLLKGVTTKIPPFCATKRER